MPATLVGRLYSLTTLEARVNLKTQAFSKVVVLYLAPLRSFSQETKDGCSNEGGGGGGGGGCLYS